MRLRRSGLWWLAAAALTCAPISVLAQNDLTAFVENGFLRLTVGSGQDVAGSMQLRTTATNPNAPNTILFYGPPLVLRPAAVNNIIQPVRGSMVYLRVDGGLNGTGYDYIVGDQAAVTTEGGIWVVPPFADGNKIRYVWRTRPIQRPNHGGTGGGGTGGGGTGGGGTGGGGGGTGTAPPYDPRIEVEMIATFLRDTVRFQWEIRNRDAGRAHNVGLAFIQDINAVPGTVNVDGPVRVPNGPYLTVESSLFGTQVPEFYETFAQVSGAQGGNPPIFHSIRGTLRPGASLQNEPTPPTRMVYATTGRAHGFGIDRLTLLPVQRDYRNIWNLTADPSIVLGRPVGSNVKDAAVGLYWGETAIAPGQNRTIVTYAGQSTGTTDFSGVMALGLYAPNALSFNQGNVTPNPFQVSATVRNMFDLQGTGTTLGTVNLTINLPAGLTLEGSPSTQTINGIAPGGESTVTWNVRANGSVSGPQTVSVTATPVGFGVGKTLQRTIEVPAPPAVTLIGNQTGRGLYQMVSFPLQFTPGTAPSTILGLNNNPPDFDLVRYNPLITTPGILPYEPVNEFRPGQAYWLRSRLPNTQRIVLNGGRALENQVQPGASQYSVDYPRGWNQIGNPFLYGIRLSEIQVFDQETLRIVNLDEAASPLVGWVLPALYRYDTSDPDPRNWSYILIDNLGTVMQPYEGYWVLIRKSGLRFLYPGVDTPGVTVTRSPRYGMAALSSANASNNWRLRISARGETSSDLTSYIGVAPQASDSMDSYKYEKPPIIGNQLTLDLVGRNYPSGTRLAQDLRSPVMGRKTWDLIVRSPKPNENVTLSWSDIAASVPRDYHLTLVDRDNNVHRNMRSNATYVLNTGEGAVRRLQVVAEPTRGAGRVQITSFDVMPNVSAGRSVSSVAINYTFSHTAEAQVVVRDAGGRILRILSPRTRSENGGQSNEGSAVWDLRDNQGIALPSGLYNLELVARTEDGQRTRNVKPYLLTR